MPYIIHNCVYKMIDAVKGQRTQKHHMIQKRLSKRLKDSMEKRKKYPEKLGYIRRWNSKARPKDFVARMYISGDNNTQIALANSLIISTWRRDTMETDKHLHCSLLLSHGKNEIISACATTRLWGFSPATSTTNCNWICALDKVICHAVQLETNIVISIGWFFVHTLGTEKN